MPRFMEPGAPSFYPKIGGISSYLTQRDNGEKRVETHTYLLHTRVAYMLLTCYLLATYLLLTCCQLATYRAAYYLLPARCIPAGYLLSTAAYLLPAAYLLLARYL